MSSFDLDSVLEHLNDSINRREKFRGDIAELLKLIEGGALLTVEYEDDHFRIELYRGTNDGTIYIDDPARVTADWNGRTLDRSDGRVAEALLASWVGSLVATSHRYP